MPFGDPATPHAGLQYPSYAVQSSSVCEETECGLWETCWGPSRYAKRGERGEEKEREGKRGREEKRREKQKVKGIPADTMYIGERGRSSRRHVRYPLRYAEKEDEEKKEEKKKIRRGRENQNVVGSPANISSELTGCCLWETC